MFYNQDTINAATELTSDLDYLYSKINWVESFLDAKAVRIRNNMSNDILKLAQTALVIAPGKSGYSGLKAAFIKEIQRDKMPDEQLYFVSTKWTDEMLNHLKT